MAETEANLLQYADNMKGLYRYRDQQHGKYYGCTINWNRLTFYQKAVRFLKIYDYLAKFCYNPCLGKVYEPESYFLTESIIED